MWQIILVDSKNNVRNGGIAYRKKPYMAEKEAWSRAKYMEDNFGVKINWVFCERMSYA
jgi:hypothetical protein